MTRLLVVGGGITGLAAAWEGIQRGAEVTVVEASGRFGGKLVTEHVDGLTIEHGPDAVVAYRPAALALAAEVGLGEEIVEVGPDRLVWLRADGRLHPIPAGMGMVLPTRLGPFVGTSILSWRHKLRAGLDLVLPRRLGPEDVAIGDFLRARLGDGIVRRFADPMVGGIYGASVDELSLDAVLPSLRANERDHRSLLLAALTQGRAARRSAVALGGDSARGPSSPFRSLARGLGSLPDAVAARLAEQGADLRTACHIARLTPGATTTVEYADGTVEETDAVILAGGATSSAYLLAQHVPAAAAALRAVRHASTVVITLAYDASAFEAPVATHGWLEAGPAPVSGVTVSSAKWPGRAPAGMVLLRAFVSDRVGSLAQAPEAEILAAVTAHVAKVLHARRAPLLTRLTRWSDVMPKYTVGHLDRVAAVDHALAAYPTWQVAGSALRGVGIPDCISDGRRAAAVVLTADERSVRR